MQCLITAKHHYLVYPTMPVLELEHSVKQEEQVAYMSAVARETITGILVAYTDVSAVTQHPSL